jgi:hypothetical protein
LSTAHAPALPGPPFFERPGDPSLTPDHRRLLACATISALVVAIGILTINVSLRLDFARLIPAVLDVTLREKTRPETLPAPLPEVVEPTEAPAVESAPPASTTTAEPSSTPAIEPAAGSPAAAIGAQPVDWYAALERAAAVTVEGQSAVDSLHPEFDELRRVAAERYAPAASGAPKPIWENVEKDIYGRTLLRHGNCFRVLDDTNVGNRYAFETFEQYLVQCSFGFGRKRGKNLPWVEPIRARYNHLRDPDGSNSVPGAGIPTSAD